MEACTEESNTNPPAAKKQMTCLMKCPTESGVDRISQLPDVTLYKIMSLLTMKEAVCTTVLSHRWNNLWASMPNLCFPLPETQFWNEKYANFVDRVLLLRERSDLDSFMLSWEFHVDRDRAETWVRYALKCKVCELTLKLNHELSAKIPSSLFSSQSLEVLRLNMWEGSLPIDHHPVRLVSLRELHLDQLNLNGDPFRKLILGCPALEILHVENCYCSKDLEICASRLRSLNLSECGSSSVHIRVHAPCLLSFNYSDKYSNGPAEYDFDDVSSLVNATIDSQYSGSGKNVIRILKGICNVEELTLSQWAILSLSRGQDLAHSLPMLPNLKKLKLSMELQKDVISAVACILQHAPNLEKISVENHVPNVKKGEESCKLEELSCDLLHLKTVEIRSFGNTACENEFMKFLKANAVALMSMVTLPATSA